MLIAALASLLGGGFSFWAVPPALLLGVFGLFNATPAAAQATVTLSVSDTSLEPGESATVTATLSAVQSGWVTVNLTRGGTADGSRYAGLISSIFIAAGSLSATATIDHQDSLTGAFGTLTVSIGTILTESGTVQAGSPSSVTINLVESSTPPAAPTDVSITATDRTLSLSWTRTFGATGHDVAFTRSTMLANTAQAVSSGNSATDWIIEFVGVLGNDRLTLLTNGETYRVRVRAKNAAGASDWVFVKGVPGAASTNAPAAPAGLGVTAGNAELRLRWTAMGDASGYDVQYTSAPTSGAGAVVNDAAVQNVSAAAGWLAVTRSGAAAFQKITGLTNSTDYRVRVRAKNSNGNSAWVFGAGTPKAPTVWSFAPTKYTPTEEDRDTAEITIQLAAAAPSGGVTFTLTPLFGTSVPSTTHSRLCDVNSGRAERADLGTSVPTTLTVQAGQTEGTARFPIIVDAVDDHNECFAIRAATTASSVTLRTGTQQYDVAHVLVQERVPDEPTGLTVAPGNTKLDLSWLASAVGVVAGYDVHYTSATVDNVANSVAATGTDATAAWVAVPRSGTTATQSITGLTNGRAYRVRVRATNSGGLSPWVFATGTPNTKTFEFTRDSHLVPPAKGFFDLRIRLSEAAPAGGLSFTLTQLLGASVPAGLCDDGEEKATAEDIGANPPAALTVQAGRPAGVLRGAGEHRRVRLVARFGRGGRGRAEDRGHPGGRGFRRGAALRHRARLCRHVQ